MLTNTKITGKDSKSPTVSRLGISMLLYIGMSIFIMPFCTVCCRILVLPDLHKMQLSQYWSTSCRLACWLPSQWLQADPRLEGKSQEEDTITESPGLEETSTECLIQPHFIEQGQLKQVIPGYVHSHFDHLQGW